MSKLSEYSKFDHLDDDDDGSDNDNTTNETGAKSCATTTAAVTPAPTATNMRKDEKTGRFVFEYNGNSIYQWEQTLDDVTIYVRPPTGITCANQIRIEIHPRHFKLGLHGASQWFLNEPTFGLVSVSESTWSLEDDDNEDEDKNDNDNRKVIVVYLIKAHRGELWDAALQGIGHDKNSNNNTTVTSTRLDPMAKEQVKKELLLERFQEENPGFDFRGATFNGSVPDARTFMGGVQYH